MLSPLQAACASLAAMPTPLGVVSFCKKFLQNSGVGGDEPLIRMISQAQGRIWVKTRPGWKEHYVEIASRTEVSEMWGTSCCSPESL